MTLLLEEPNLLRSLGYNYVFRGLSRQVVAGLAALASVRSYRGGDVMVREFEQATDLIVILEGSARITGFSGELLAEFGPGSIVGEIALVDEQPRSATVRAVGNVTAAILPRAALMDMMEADPEVGRVVMTNIAKVLCKRMRTMNAHTSSALENHASLR